MSDLQHERITALAAELRLGAMADLYGAVAQDAAKRKDASYADFLEQVLRAERDARRVRSASMLARTAGFPAIKTLDDYDFSFATGAKAGALERGPATRHRQSATTDHRRDRLSAIRA